MLGFDAQTMREAFAGPGMDTRQWVSFGIVERGGEGDNSPIQFTDEYGPLVSVTLQPSNITVPCRVGAACAGNGEGEWFPFLEQDEVLVAIPEGDERAGCTIIARLNNEIDKWPIEVAGQDPRKNNFAFRRLRTPYIIETASSYLIRSATTGAFFGISTDGRITIGNADGAYLSLNPDFIGLQDGSGSLLIQLDLQDSAVVLEGNGSKLTLSADGSNFVSKGTLSIGVGGGLPIQHAATIEGVINLLNNFALQIGIQAPGPLTGVALAGLIIPLLNAAIAATIIPATGAITPFLPALTPVLQTQGLIKDPAGQQPGLGSSNLLIA